MGQKSTKPAYPKPTYSVQPRQSILFSPAQLSQSSASYDLNIPVVPAPSDSNSNRNGDCFDYYATKCARGAQCGNRHEPSALGHRKECHYWRRGCRKVNCTFRHMDLNVEINKKTVNCSNYNCTDTSCPYRHNKQGHCSATWFWKDELGNWIKYGENNTIANSTSSIDSSGIENFYKNNPKGQGSFTSSKGETYILDFEDMVQINVRYQTRRPIKREATNTRNPRNGFQYGLPPHWKPMGPTALYEIVDLSFNDDEYKQVQQIFEKTSGDSCTRICRVQNKRLWKNYQNKKSELITMYDKNFRMVNEQKLFHGTNYDKVQKICEESLDWRLCGSNVGTLYGKGVYFAKSASISKSYCTSSNNGENAMFLCKVLVGTMVTGDTSMVRPPENPSTGHLYDTTVNSVSNPTIFVKYYCDTFYPEYLIYF